MKFKIFGALLLSLSASFCACSNSRKNTINSSLNSLELTGKVDIISNKNDIKSAYKSGEKIRIELSSVTDVSFYVFVNDQKVEESPYDSVEKYGVFEFDMPNEKATVVVTSDKFYHQVFCYADTKAFVDSNVTNIQVKISGSDETGLATYYSSSDAQDIKNFKEVAHKEIKRSNANYSSNSVERRIYLKNEYTDGTDYICFIDSFDNYLCNSGDFNGPEVFEFVDSNYSIPTVSDKASVSYSFYDKKNRDIKYKITRADDSTFDDGIYCTTLSGSLSNFQFVEFDYRELNSIINTEILYYLDVENFGRITLINEKTFRWNDKYWTIIDSDFYSNSYLDWPYTYAMNNDNYF